MYLNSDVNFLVFSSIEQHRLVYEHAAVPRLSKEFVGGGKSLAARLPRVETDPGLRDEP